MKKPRKPHGPKIRIVISSLEEFAAFVAVLRGEENVDPAEVEAMRQKLKMSSDKLQADVNAATPKP